MSDSAYRVRWFSRASDIDDALWQSWFAPPLEGRWWYEALEAAQLLDQFEFHYALVEDAASCVPVALAPVFVMNVPIRLVVPPAILPLVNLAGRFWPGFLHQRTLFAGSPCSDEGWVGMAPDVCRAAVYAALDRALEAKVREVGAVLRVWKDFAVRSHPELASVAKSRGLFALESFPGTEVVLGAPTKAAYLAGIKRKHRYSLKRKVERSRAAATLEIEVLHEPDDATLAEIFGLFWRTYERATTQFERLNPAFFAAIARALPAHFIVLRESGTRRVVAFMLCFLFEGHAINKFIGIDYERPREWFLYFRLWDVFVDWALAHGARVMQSGQTVYTPKLEIGHSLVRLVNYGRHRNALMHWIYGKVAASVSWSTLDADLAAHLAAHPEVHPEATTGSTDSKPMH